MSSLADLVRYFEMIQRTSQERIEKFSVKLVNPEQRPYRTLEWAMQELTAAAELEVATKVLSVLTKEDATEMDVGGLRDRLRDRVVNEATRPKRSTSPLSNLMDQEYLAALARAVDTLNGGWV